MHACLVKQTITIGKLFVSCMNNYYFFCNLGSVKLTKENVRKVSRMINYIFQVTYVTGSNFKECELLGGLSWGGNKKFLYVLGGNKGGGDTVHP